jgi:hypothetical protein
MQSKASNPGLPPVQPPPSASTLLKQFGIPLMIVGTLIAAFFAFSALMPGCGTMRSWDTLLADMGSSNPEVRWRTAQDLAQRLLRDEMLASDPAFGLTLTERLKEAIDDVEKDEQALDEKRNQNPQGGFTTEEAALETKRTYSYFLCNAAGMLTTPAAVSELKRMAEFSPNQPARVQMMRRWRALWSLANLGENLKRFDKLSADRQEQIIAGFTKEVASDGPRGSWARECIAALEARRAGVPTTLGVDRILIQASDDQGPVFLPFIRPIRNPFLREVAIFAMNFWEGDPATNKRMEDALLARLDDHGEGEEQLAPFYADDRDRDRQFTSEPGLRIRYNAALALARRGSDKVPLDLLAEMLDESRQKDVHRIVYHKDNREASDEPTAYETMQQALKTVQELHRRNSSVNLTVLSDAIKKIEKESGNPGVRNEAKRTREALGF